MNNKECDWNPAKHDGKPCPTHGGSGVNQVGGKKERLPKVYKQLDNAGIHFSVENGYFEFDNEEDKEEAFKILANEFGEDNINLHGWNLSVDLSEDNDDFDVTTDEDLITDDKVNDLSNEERIKEGGLVGEFQRAGYKVSDITDKSMKVNDRFTFRENKDAGFDIYDEGKLIAQDIGNQKDFVGLIENYQKQNMFGTDSVRDNLHAQAKAKLGDDYDPMEMDATIAGEMLDGNIDYDKISYPKGTSKEHSLSMNRKYQNALPILEKAGIDIKDFGGKASKEGGYEDNSGEIMEKYVFEPFRKKYPKGNNEAWEKEYEPLYEAIESVLDKNYNDWYIRNKK